MNINGAVYIDLSWSHRGYCYVSYMGGGVRPAAEVLQENPWWKKIYNNKTPSVWGGRMAHGSPSNSKETIKEGKTAVRPLISNKNGLQKRRVIDSEVNVHLGEVGRKQTEPLTDANKHLSHTLSFALQ